MVFDWNQVLVGLFKVCWADGKKLPACSQVAVHYNGYWFYIDSATATRWPHFTC